MRIDVRPIGYVHSDRKEAIDDNWGGVKCYIELNKEIPAESLHGLSEFSHIEIIYFFHKVSPETVIFKSDHPRENPDFPKVGIFAQRKKARPNRLGLTAAKIEKIEDKRIYISHFDGIDGTPIIDIKPLFIEYLPGNISEIRQPHWVTGLMKGYW